MKLFSILVSALCLTIFLEAEVTTEFDGDKWKTAGNAATRDDDMLKNGLCLSADAKMKMKEAAPVLVNLGRLQPYSIRLTLRGQEGKGAVLEPLPKDAAKTDLMMVVTCDPKGIDLGCVRVTNGYANESFESAMMSVDFEGREKFVSAIKSNMQRANDQKTPIILRLKVRSVSSWAQMVSVLQLLNSAGCCFGIIEIDDTFPGMHIEVTQDPNVTPPKPTYKEANLSKFGRIVVNIHKDGMVSDSDGKKLSTDDEIIAYVKKQKIAAEEAGIDAVLHLRGSKDVVFKTSRRIIKLAETVNVTKIQFATYEDHEEVQKNNSSNSPLPKSPIK